MHTIFKIQIYSILIFHTALHHMETNKDCTMMNLGARHQNLDQKAYEIIKSMILNRKLLPGQKIPQEKLAQELGISRTPLVSALKYLEQEKLVAAKPRRGFFVRLFTVDEMINIFELREVLDGLAARRAATFISATEIEKIQGFFQPFAGQAAIKDIKGYAKEDRRFHKFVIAIGAKEFLKSMLDTYNLISYSYQLVASEGLVRPPDETIHEHMAMIAAICDRDGETAEELMRTHFKRTTALIKVDLKRNGYKLQQA